MHFAVYGLSFSSRYLILSRCAPMMVFNIEFVMFNIRVILLNIRVIFFTI